MPMYNKASSCQMLVEARMTADFKEKFPAIVEKYKSTLHFYNDPTSGEASWGDVVLVSVKHGNLSLASVYLGRLYGNCGVCVLAEMAIFHDIRRQGVGTWLMEWSIHLMGKLGYTIALATTNDDHQMQFMKKILTKHNWKVARGLTFVNRRTASDITTWKLKVPRVSGALE